MKVAKNILVGLPADILADLEAVCPARGRTRFIVAAIREKLGSEPAAQRAREERAAAIKAKAGTGELTPEEEAQWWHEAESRPAARGPDRYIYFVGDRICFTDNPADLPEEYRRKFGVDDDSEGND